MLVSSWLMKLYHSNCEWEHFNVTLTPIPYFTQKQTNFPTQIRNRHFPNKNILVRFKMIKQMRSESINKLGLFVEKPMNHTVCTLQVIYKFKAYALWAGVINATNSIEINEKHAIFVRNRSRISVCRLRFSGKIRETRWCCCCCRFLLLLL